MSKELRKGIILMLGSSVCVCLGQLLWKVSTTNNGIGFMLGGFALYGIGALFMIVAYKYGKVSVLQPILSMNYVLSLILAAVVLKENLTTTRIIGAMIITIGVFLIASSDKENSENTPKQETV